MGQQCWLNMALVQTKLNHKPREEENEGRNQWKPWTRYRYHRYAYMRTYILILFEWYGCLDNWWAKSLNSVAFECAVSRYRYLPLWYTFAFWACVNGTSVQIKKSRFVQIFCLFDMCYMFRYSALDSTETCKTPFQIQFQFVFLFSKNYN